jgi:hypothetical protein
MISGVPDDLTNPLLDEEPFLTIGTRGPPRDQARVSVLVAYVLERSKKERQSPTLHQIIQSYGDLFGQLTTVFGLTGADILIRRASAHALAAHPLLAGLHDTADPGNYFVKMGSGPQPPDLAIAHEAVEGLITELFIHLEKLIGIELLTRLIENTPFPSRAGKGK